MRIAADGRELERSKLLRVRARIERAELRFAYDVDRHSHQGEIRVSYPFALPAGVQGALPAIALGVATYLGQLCLAERLELDTPVTDALADAMRPLAEMLYDIRHWMDKLPLGGPPSCAGGGTWAPPADVSLDPQRAIVMSSGGKDSALAALLLRRDGIAVSGLHVTANAGVERLEREAARRLSAQLGLDLDELELVHPQFMSLSSRYAIQWNQFPKANRVPFGRDLLLSVLAVPALMHRGAGLLSFGHEHECRNARISYEGKLIPRNDVESKWGALALESFLRTFALPGVTMRPPLAGFTDFRIIQEMLLHHRALWASTSFCFWGANCGRCGKCLRYYLAQRVLQRELLRFQVNPLADRNCPELDDLLVTVGPHGTLFQIEVLYMMGQLCQRRDIRPDEHRLAEFAASGFDAVAPSLDGWGRDLLQTHDDPQLPALDAGIAERVQ